MAFTRPSADKKGYRIGKMGVGQQDRWRRASKLALNDLFTAGNVGWSISGADVTHIVTFAGGKVRYQSDTTTPVLTLQKNNLLTVGKKYKVTTVVSAYVSGSLKEGATGAVLTAGPGKTVITFVATQSAFAVQRNSTNVDITIDSMMIEQV